LYQLYSYHVGTLSLEENHDSITLVPVVRAETSTKRFKTTQCCYSVS
jgi:hypothetical protein